MNAEIKKILNLSVKIENDYLEKFGKNSLDRVIRVIYDPGVNEKEFLEDISRLEKAIETGSPIEQITPEQWEKLIF